MAGTRKRTKPRPIPPQHLWPPTGGHLLPIGLCIVDIPDGPWDPDACAHAPACEFVATREWEIEHKIITEPPHWYTRRVRLVMAMRDGYEWALRGGPEGDQLVPISEWIDATP